MGPKTRCATRFVSTITRHWRPGPGGRRSYVARRTKAEAEATREAILDAAEEVFIENGVSRATLEQIARRAGVTRGAVYWHFKDKNDLFTAMINRVRLPMRTRSEERRVGKES